MPFNLFIFKFKFTKFKIGRQFCRSTKNVVASVSLDKKKFKISIYYLNATKQSKSKFHDSSFHEISSSCAYIANKVRVRSGLTYT